VRVTIVCLVPRDRASSEGAIALTKPAAVTYWSGLTRNALRLVFSFMIDSCGPW
jgi:hypothetical protein